MKCQKCGVNPANVNVAMQLNHERTELHLCQSCFKEMQGKMVNPTSFFSDSFFGNDNDFANQFFLGNGASKGAGTRTKERANRGNGLLDQLGKNLTDDARQNQIDPVIGRDKEVKRVIETLNRRNKNNPVLIGEPGVGKTAIAEGLALKIVQGDVPAKLMNKEVYLLDVASLVANTGVRGQFEERMKQLIQELQSRKDVILFV
ncbi:MAG TPA: AAA family ATPase, partial [Cerasibacillus sp.]|uniref:AAA family ATPase n=1 Tax=Cerasibacillus sp. TaxID=2498711 RepID=UPI002F4104D4